MIYTVRLALLSPEELADIEKENDETHFIPVDMLAQAWKMHALKSKGSDKGSIRLRRGTKPRDIHNFIALAANRNPSSDSESGGDDTGKKILEASKSKETSSDSWRELFLVKLPILFYIFCITFLLNDMSEKKALQFSTYAN